MATLLSCHADRLDPLAERPHTPAILREAVALTESPVLRGCQRERVSRIESRLRVDSNDASARLALADIYVTCATHTGRHGDYHAAAARLLRGLLRGDCVDSTARYEALTALGQLQRARGDYQSALQTIGRAVEIRPCSAQAFGLAFDCHMDLGHYDEAGRAIDRMLASEASKCAFARLSKFREVVGDLPGAMEALRDALGAERPGREGEQWARLKIGGLLRDYGQYAEARHQYELALAGEPGSRAARIALAGLALDDADVTRAGQLLSEIAGNGGGRGGDYHALMVRLYRALGDAASADAALAKLFDALAEQAAGGQNVNLAYADVHINLTRQYGLALDYVTLEYERRPDNIEVNRRLATINYLYGDNALALEHIKVAERTGSQHPELLLVDGLLALERGDTTAGHERIETVRALSAAVPVPLAEELSYAAVSVGR